MTSRAPDATTPFAAPSSGGRGAGAFASGDPGSANDAIASDHWALLHATIDAARDGLLAIDELGHVRLVNRRFLELWRVPPELREGDVLPALRAHLVAQVADPDAFRAAFDRLRADPRAAHAGRIDLRDGRVVDWHSHPSIVNGRHAGRLYGFHDVTDSALAERALEQRLRLESAIARIAASLTGAGPLDLTTVLAELGHAVRVHRAYLFHLRSDGLTADNTHEWCAEGVAPQIELLQGVDLSELGMFFRHIVSGLPVVIDDVAALPPAEQPLHELLAQQGIRSLIAVPVLNREQGPIGFIGFDDVVGPRRWSDEDQRALRVVGDLIATELDRRRAADALRVGEERLREVLDATTEGFWEWDIVADRVTFSDRWFAILREHPDSLRDDALFWLERVHPDDRAAASASLRAHLKGDTPRWQSEQRVRDAQGEWLWIVTRGRVVARDEHGRALRLVGTHTDVTARRELEDQLRQAQKMEAIGRLAGGIAHDFNNLLTGVIGHALLMMPRLEGDDAAVSHAQEIRKAADRAAQLTQQLLAFSRKQILRPRVVDLTEVVSDTESLLARMIGENIEFTTDGRTGDTAVRADPSQLQQVLLNLVVNARDAMPGGGRLLIEVHPQRLTRAMPAVHGQVPAGDWVLLAVTDTGHGIDPELLPRLFEPFFTTKAPGKGTGLGLATVYGIVTQSGGHVAVNTAPGAGTTFRVYLPRVAEAPVTPRSRAAVDQGIAYGTGRVLLVEDDATVRLLVSKVLGQSGYTVLEAATPVEALRLVPELGHVDVIVSDLVMPGMNGVELIARLRQRFPDARVLVMSGCSDREVADSGIFEAGYGFIGKPFTPRALTTKLAAVLSRQDTPARAWRPPELPGRRS
jgi:PAS domain S-box-containing protein